jgi:maspardin
MSDVQAAPTISVPDISLDEMERDCVYRWQNSAPLTDAFLLSRIPGFESKIHKLINKGVLENAAVKPGIKREHPFSVTVIELPPGKGTGLHAHRTEEVFFPLDGRMHFIWGDHGQHEIELGPWDCISVPIDHMRAFSNRSDRTVHMLAIVAGTNAQTKGSITYHDSVIVAAEKSGLRLDEKGHLVVADANDGVMARLATLRRLYPVQTIRAGGHHWPHIDTGGPGEAVVLLPGSQGTCEMYFEELLALGGDHRMIAASYPAISDVDGLAEGLFAFMEVKDLKSAVVVGSSFSAYWVQHFAAKYPDRVNRLVICNGFASADEVQADVFAPHKVVPVAAEELKAARVVKLAQLPDVRLREVLEELMVKQQDADNLKARLVGVATARPITRPALSPEKVVVVDCEDDTTITPAMREEVRKLYQGARRITLSRGGHFPHVSNPREFTDALRSILAV